MLCCLDIRHPPRLLSPNQSLHRRGRLARAFGQVKRIHPPGCGCPQKAMSTNLQNIWSQCFVSWERSAQGTIMPPHAGAGGLSQVGVCVALPDTSLLSKRKLCLCKVQTFHARAIPSFDGTNMKSIFMFYGNLKAPFPH